MKIIKKLDRCETHDRLIEFGKQSDYISEGCQNCINSRPVEFGDLPFYIFAHCRTADDGYSKRLIWCPRLTKPKAQTNSMLFRCIPPDKIQVVWMLPDKHLWPQYRYGVMTQNQIVSESIDTFIKCPELLEAPHVNDISEEKAMEIYKEIARNSKRSKRVSSVASEVF